MGPKVFGRLLRLRHAVEQLGRADLAAVAAECGFSDQAHFTREVRALTGLTPTELIALRSPFSKTAEMRAA